MPFPFGWPGARARYAAAILATPGCRHLWGFEEGYDPYTSVTLASWNTGTVFTDEAGGANGGMVPDPGGEVVFSAALICCLASQGSGYNLHGN